MSEEKHGTFKVGQNIILINENKKLLLVKELNGGWNWPGGRLHEGENWEEGLRREIKEELGFDKFEIIGIYSVQAWNKKVPHYTVEFVGRVPSDTKVILDVNEILDFAWVSEENIDNFNYQHKKVKDGIKYVLENYAK